MRVAIIGSGIAGLGAAWFLRGQADVTLFEQADRLGGHSHTVAVDYPGCPAPLAIDTGFIVYNTATYPHLIALFQALDVPTQPSDMSFALSLDGGAYEYAGDSLTKLAGHAGNLFRPGHWRMIADLIRFMRDGRRLCELPPTQTLGDYLQKENYSAAFRDYHILPMAAAIWSAAPADILAFPAQSFGRFFRNHGLLEPATGKRPQWRTVSGGARVYVDRLAAAARARIVLNARIAAVHGDKDSPRIIFADGAQAEFDHVIVAAHADEALRLLPQADAVQRELLGAFRYSANHTYLHSDAALMPRRRRLWASWNYLRDAKTQDSEKVFVTYWMNRLQSIDRRYPLFVSLNPLRPPQADRIFRQILYQHPQFDLAALRAQNELRRLQGRGRLWFCGSYFGYGFHEDALASAAAVAGALGAPRPWAIADSSPAFANASLAGHDA